MSLDYRSKESEGFCFPSDVHQWQVSKKQILTVFYAENSKHQSWTTAAERLNVQEGHLFHINMTSARNLQMDACLQKIWIQFLWRVIFGADNHKQCVFGDKIRHFKVTLIPKNTLTQQIWQIFNISVHIMARFCGF